MTNRLRPMLWLALLSVVLVAAIVRQSEPNAQPAVPPMSSPSCEVLPDNGGVHAVTVWPGVNCYWFSGGSGVVRTYVNILLVAPLYSPVVESRLEIERVTQPFLGSDCFGRTLWDCIANVSGGWDDGAPRKVTLFLDNRGTGSIVGELHISVIAPDE